MATEVKEQEQHEAPLCPLVAFDDAPAFQERTQEILDRLRARWTDVGKDAE